MANSRQTAIRLPVELAAAIDAAASARGMTQSDFIRYAIRVLLDRLTSEGGENGD